MKRKTLYEFIVQVIFRPLTFVGPAMLGNEKKRTKSWMCLQKSLSQQNIFRCFLCTKCFICVAISCFSALNDNSIFVLEKEEYKFKHIIQTHTHTNVHVHQIKTIFKIKLPYCKRMRDSSEFCNYANTIFVEQFLFVWGTM